MLTTLSSFFSSITIAANKERGEKREDGEQEQIIYMNNEQKTTMAEEKMHIVLAIKP